MTRIRFQTLCFALLLVLQSFIATGSQITPSDSIRRQLPHLSGAAKLQALNNLCYIAGNQNDSINELNYIEAFRKEAAKQHNVDDETEARVMRLNCLYNYQMRDQMAEELPENLNFFAKHERWDKYYGKWTLLVETCLNNGQFQTALNETQKIYADAKKRKNASGIGIACSCLGKTYWHMRMYSQSAKNFAEALKYLKPGVNDTELLDTYDAYSTVLNNTYKYEKIKELGPNWLKLLDSYKTSYLSQGIDISALADFYRKYYTAMGTAEGGLGHYPQAKALLDKALALCADASPLAKVSTLASLTLYYTDIKDSISSDETSSQLNELNTIYKVDKLKQEKRVNAYRFYASIACSFLLLVILAISVYNVRALRRKNKVIYDRLKENRIEYESPKATEMVEKEKKSLSIDESTYVRLCELMQEDEIYKNPLLDRDELASRLGTNRYYLLEIIKAYSAFKNVADFVNSYRLKYASTLLSDKLEMSITEIGEASGFNSRSSFNRLFLVRYGMTPSEFRRISTLESKES
jgi:AraC-like DNA-binding protein